jgi:hypothetical protein
MLTIKDDQFETLRKGMLENFEDQMVEHLKKFFPEQYQSLGEKEVRKAIRHGMNRAKTYGIITQRDVSKFLNIMFVFGLNFDQDPRYPWISKTLKKAPALDPTWVINDLYDNAIEKADEGKGLKE